MYPWGDARPYHSYAAYCRRTFGRPIQKLPVDGGFTCPNRDGTVGHGGCSFCSNEAFTPAYCDPRRTVRQQVDDAIAFHRRGFPAGTGFLVYFQSYSNTYAPLERLQRLFGEALACPGVAGIVVGTRPDCVDEGILAALAGRSVTAVELGAQSMDDAVLVQNGRGHTAADVERAAGLIRARGLSLGLQMMTGLPGSTPDTDRETAARLAALRPDTMRIYPTVALRGTPLDGMVRSGAYIPPTLEETVALCAELLLFFEEERDIPVIRLGLHASPDLEQNRVAGPWHPAFRELCEGRIYRDRAASLLRECGIPPGPVRLLVHPRALSAMIGQRRGNVVWFRERGYRVEVEGDPALSRYRVKIGG